MEPPYWYYPVRQSLAVALMQASRLDEAEEQFQRALKRAPSNGWSRYGLADSIGRVARPTRRASWKRILPRCGSVTDSSWSYRSCDPQHTVPPGGGRGN